MAVEPRFNLTIVSVILPIVTAHGSFAPFSDAKHRSTAMLQSKAMFDSTIISKEISSSNAMPAPLAN